MHGSIATSVSHATSLVPQLPLVSNVEELAGDVPKGENFSDDMCLVKSLTLLLNQRALVKGSIGHHDWC